MEILNAYDNSKIVVPETTIPAGKKNFYNIFNNIFLETEVQITGNSGTKVFIKHAGVRNAYYPSLKDSPKVNFNPDLNQLLVDSPINNYERIQTYQRINDNNLNNTNSTIIHNNNIE